MSVRKSIKPVKKPVMLVNKLSVVKFSNIKQLPILKPRKKQPWDAPSVFEELSRVLKGKPAHPNDEVSRKRK